MPGMFGQPLVSPTIYLSDEQKARAAALLVAREVVPDAFAFAGTIVTLAEYILDGYGSYRLVLDTEEASHGTR